MTRTFDNATIQVENLGLTYRDLSDDAEIRPSQMQQQPFAAFHVPLTSLRVWDAIQTLLTTAANDDCGITTGTPGTDQPYVTTGDVKAAGAVSRKFAFELAVPPNYQDGESIRVRLRAAMKTTIADTTATIDVEAYLPNGNGGVGSDLVSTTAQSMNSITAADYDFNITPSSVDPGDKLLVIVTMAVNDAATATAVIGAVYDVVGQFDTKG